MWWGDGIGRGWLERGERMEGRRYIVAVTAQDRSGIVAGISEAVFELKGNIEAASQTVHRGYFSMIVLCTFGQTVEEEGVGASIRAKAGEDLHVYVTEQRPVAAAGEVEEQTFIVTAIGPDRPGILQALSGYLAAKRINIADLYCSVEKGDFVVVCEVTIPTGQDVAMLQMDLESVGQERGFTVAMQHENIFKATNQVESALSGR